MSGVLKVVDLFAGGGGTTEGVLQAAAELDLRTEAVAINHWQTAVATHTENHRTVRHYCADIQKVDPLEVVPDGTLDLLWASPECTHHSRARGGKPVSEQKRSGADWVLEWLERLDVRCLILENVEEWLSWGDVKDGKPVSKTRGKLFVRWWNRLLDLGYRAEYRVLNAADFGDATTRKRLFVQARKDDLPIVWPEPTHSKTGSADLVGTLQKWRPAHEIIDWSDLGKSLFDRKAPLYIRLLDLPAEDERKLIEKCANGDAKAFLTSQFNSTGGIGCRSVDLPTTTVTTVSRIGLATPKAEPFTFANREHAGPKGTDEPIATATTATGGGMYLASAGAEPFVLGQQSNSAPRDPGQPIPTIATAGIIRLFSPTAVPLVDQFYGTGVADTVDVPLSTATTKPRHALVSPLVVPYGPRAEARPDAEPMPTIMTKDRLGVATPTIVQIDQAGSAGPGVRSADEPLSTLVTKANCAVITPIASVITPGFAEREGQLPRVHDIDEPMPAIAATGHLHLATATAEQIREAIGQVDPRRLVFIDGVLHLLDIYFRMLKPEELAAAMGFPPGYRFTGTKTDQVKQIGNAVAVGVSRALVLAMFGGNVGLERRAS